MKTKRFLALLLAAGMTLGLFTACGGNNSANTDTTETQQTTETAAPETTDDANAAETEAADTEAEAEESSEPTGTTGLDLATDFSYLIDQSVESYFYESYEENPVYKYWSNMEWDAYGEGNKKKISIDFIEPPASGGTDYVNTLMATGEYPDIMSMSLVSTKANALYDEGIVLDITDYVEKYMPNYMAWMEEHPEYADMLYNNIDGEKRIIQLYGFGDAAPERGNGFLYRRDWVVKYGKNPETGKAFTGGYDDNGTWSDDVVFPSGSTFPVYLSDWEWMFEIFEEAMKDQGITDGYIFQLPNSGYWGTGEFVTGFGAGSTWFINEDGECEFGAVTDSMRAYLECMNTWYNNGWLDNYFMEQPDAIFWSVDTASVFSGKVGVWYGLKGVVGGQIDSGDESSPAYGAYAAAAPSPINDLYGDKSVQGHKPSCFFGASLVGQTSTVITNKAEEKDIPTFLTAIDYLYGREGGILRSYGMNGEQAATVTDSTFYADQGFEDGFYQVEERDGEEWIVTPAEDTLETGLRNAMIMERVMGLTVYDHVDQGFSDNMNEALNIWVTYDNVGYITGVISGQLTTEQADDYSMVNANVTTYMAQAVPQFITGELDINSDSDWDAYVADLESYGPYAYVEAINEVLGK